MRRHFDLFRYEELNALSVTSRNGFWAIESLRATKHTRLGFAQ